MIGFLFIGIMYVSVAGVVTVRIRADWFWVIDGGFYRHGSLLFISFLGYGGGQSREDGLHREVI